MAEVGSQRKHIQYRKDLHDISILTPEKLDGILLQIQHTQVKKAKTTADNAKRSPSWNYGPIKIGFERTWGLSNPYPSYSV